MRINGFTSGAAALLIAVAALAGAQTAPTGQPMLTAADVGYIGLFPLPSYAGAGTNDTLAYGGYALGIGPDGASLYVGCHDHGDRLARVTIPTAAKPSTVVENCTAIPNLAGIATPAGAYNGITLGGSLVADGRLIVTAYPFYSQGTDHLATSFAGASIATLAGPVRVGAAANIPPGIVAGGMGAVPPDWRGALGAAALSGLGGISIISRSSFGPALVGFNPADVGGSNAATWFVGYPDAHQTLGPHASAGTYWGQAATYGGIGWLPGTRSPFVVANLPRTFCYGAGTTDRTMQGKPTGTGHIYCYDSTGNLYQGTHSDGYDLALITYDAADLLEVKAGRKQPWEVLPKARIPLVGAPEAFAVTSATFNPSTGRLYVAMYYGAAPRLHEWQIGSGVAPPPPPTKTDCKPGTPTKIGDDAASVACVRQPDGTGTKSITETWTRLGDVPATNGGAACSATPYQVPRVEPCTPAPLPATAEACEVRGVSAPYADGDARITVRCDTNGKRPSPPVGTKLQIQRPQ